MNIQENIYIMFPKSKITLINWGENIAHIVTHNNNNNNIIILLLLYYYIIEKNYNYEVFSKRR